MSVYTHHSAHYAPVKCEPISPSGMSNLAETVAPNITSTAFPTFSQYHHNQQSSYMNGTTSPQLPPTPPSPATMSSASSNGNCYQMSLPMSSASSTHSVVKQEAITSSSNTSPTTSVNSFVFNRFENPSNPASQPVVSKSLSAQKSIENVGIAQRIAQNKQQFQDPNKRFKLNGSGRSANSVNKRNERERKRVKNVNLGFLTLRNKIPEANKKMSKVETLRKAVEYIQQLQKQLFAAGGPEPPILMFDTDCSNSQNTEDLDFFNDLDDLIY